MSSSFSDKAQTEVGRPVPSIISDDHHQQTSNEESNYFVSFNFLKLFKVSSILLFYLFCFNSMFPLDNYKIF